MNGARATPQKKKMMMMKKKSKNENKKTKGPFIATQLNSTDLLRADWLSAATGSVAFPLAGDS